MSINLSVSIVLYKTEIFHIRECISSLMRYCGPMYLYIIDNSPTDYLRYEFPIDINHEYIHLPSNPGFGKAHNLAIRKAQEMQSDYHLVINADVHFDFDVLSPMLLYMEANLKVGQMMPKILNTDGTIQRLCKLVPTPADLLFRRLANKITRDSRNKYFELHDFGYDKIMFVPYLSGCFMLLRQKSLLDVGIFDERFFMYPEDIDLTRRIAEKYETLFFPDVFVIHEHGAASHKSLKMFFIHAINIVKYFNKWGWFFDSFRDDINKKTLTQFDLL